MSSSRIIVKNLPLKITPERFKSHFEKIGQITDAKLKYTKDGKFRKFGFIGYKSEEEANKAIDYFNNTFINATKICVEKCQPLNDPNRNRPWSKYSVGSSAFEKNQKKNEKNSTGKISNDKKVKENKKLKKIEELLGPLKDDKEFKSFVNANKAIKSIESIWKNDVDFNTDEKNENKTETKQNKSDENTNEEAIKNDNENKKPQNGNNKNDDDESDFENGRLFIRNLSYTCKEEDLESLFSKYKPLVELNMPIDNFSKKPKGFAYVTFMFPEHAIKACNEFDGTVFQGRMLHILPSKSKDNDVEESNENSSSIKQQKLDNLKKNSQKSFNWNTLFINQDALANLMSEKYNVNKKDIFDVNSKKSAAVTLAVGETQIVNDIRKFLTRNGVKLDSFNNQGSERSKTTILVKNLPFKTTENELLELFKKFGSVKRVVLPEYGIAALVEFNERQEARQAFTKLAYRKFKNMPLYFEWAPVDVFEDEKTNNEDLEPLKVAENENKTIETTVEQKTSVEQNKVENKNVDDNHGDDDDDQLPEPESTLFVKNLNFSTTEDDLVKLFSKIGKCKATIARKSNQKKELLSMGYGFVEFKTKAKALQAIKTLQNHVLQDHRLELKLSTKQITKTDDGDDRKRKTSNKLKDLSGKSTKILVRNIPFEAKVKEIEELFKVFGELKYVRLPKKIEGSHRGFGFVEFVTINDAKRAFDALSHSTHLFGRRLVLEWAVAEQTQDVELLRLKEAQLSAPVAKKLKKSKILEDLGADDDFTGGDNT